METVTTFFMWCTVINGTILAFWTIWCLFAPDLVYKTQSTLFPIPRETFDVIIYSFIGLFKIFFITFNVAPYVALLIMA